MTAPLQGFGHTESPYEHPHRDWQCGWACDGKGCHIGPTATGECQVEEECVPSPDRDGFLCGRPREFGGPCSDGPLPDGACSRPTPPCQPRRSLMARRGRAVFLVTAASLGLVLLLLGSASHVPSAISPGPLTTGHQLLEDKCSACHAAGEGMHSTVDLAAGGTTTDITGRCLHCHHEFGPHATRPHGLAPTVLAHRTEVALERGPGAAPLMLQMTALGPGIPTTGEGTLDCATCHREHRGRGHDLRHLTNQQCQVCHTHAFHSLSDGHPEFGAFPHTQRSRLYFDHARHYASHFETFERTTPTGRAPAACADCHVLDPGDGAMHTRPFEVSCAGCHESQIEDRRFPGVRFVAIPALAPSKLTAAGVEIGNWPQAPGRPPEALPPFMKLLLSADPEYVAAERALGAFDLRELDDLAATKPREVRRYLLSIKRLFADVVRDGEPAIAARWRVSREPRVLGQPSIVDPIVNAQRRWFPDLLEELPRLEAAVDAPRPAPPGDAPGDAAPDAGGDAAEVPATDTVPNVPIPITAVVDEPERAGGGWRIRDFDLTIRYRPTGHADPFLRLWLDEVVRTSGTATKDAVDDDRRRIISRFFEVLAEPLGDVGSGSIASGRCLECHGISADDSGTPHVDWQPATVTPGPVRFTEFRHDPHVREVLGDDCRRCHVLEDATHDELFRHEFFARDAHTHDWLPVLRGPGTASGFQPIARDTCATCHTPRLASDDCMQCHRYHVGHAR